MTEKIFIKIFETLLNYIKCDRKKVVICGDVNVDFLQDSNHRNEMLNIVNSFGFMHTVNSPTRITANSKTTVDQIFIKLCDLKYNTSVINMGYSDHEAQLLSIELNSNSKCVPRTKVIEQRDFSDDNIRVFNFMLSRETWEDVFCKTEVNSMFDSFHNVYLHYFQLAFPMKKKRIKVERNKGWVTKGIITSSRKKKILHSLIKHKNATPEFRNYVKKYNQIFNKVIKEAKRRKNDDYISNSGNKTKAVWKVIRAETGMEQPLSQNISLQIENNRLSDPKEVADKFNTHFTNIAHQLIRNQYEDGPTELPNYLNASVMSMFLQTVTETEMKQIIRSLKNKYSCGLDGVPDYVFKKSSDYVIKPLIHIVNTSLSSGIFPTSLKTAKVTPLFKKGDTENVNNYRPVSQLSVFSKIFERVFHNRLLSYISKNSLLSPNQHGFSKSKSTETAMYEYLEAVLKALDDREHATGIFLDLSKAFDVIDHDLLIHKLAQKGVRGIPNQWIRSYLKDRHQVVVLRHDDIKENIIKTTTHVSHKSQIKYGVPQGSVLGPLLFLLYIDDINDFIELGKLILFADDTSILITAANKICMEEAIDTLMSQITNWFQKNKLIINKEKTVFMNFQSSPLVQKSDTIPYLDNTLLNSVTETKVLGIWVQENLKWDCHVKELEKKLSRACYALRVLNKSASKSTVIQAYYAYFHALLRYGVIFWGNSATSIKIFRMQKRAVRAICNLKKLETCKPHFIQLKIMTLPSLYIYECILFANEYLLNQTGQLRQNKEIHTHNTRNKNNIHMSQCRTTLYQKSVSHITVQLYNCLPSDLKSQRQKNVFKHKLKSFLVEQCFYSVKEFLNYKK